MRWQAGRLRSRSRCARARAAVGLLWGLGSMVAQHTGPAAEAEVCVCTCSRAGCRVWRALWRWNGCNSRAHSGTQPGQQTTLCKPWGCFVGTETHRSILLCTRARRRSCLHLSLLIHHRTPTSIPAPPDAYMHACPAKQTCRHTITLPPIGNLDAGEAPCRPGG